MKFIRRVYYLLSNGQVVDYYGRQGDMVDRTREEDFEVVAGLIPYKGRQELVGLLEWTEPEDEIEQLFWDNVCTGVDISCMPHRPMFEPYPEAPGEETQADMVMDVIEGRVVHGNV